MQVLPLPMEEESEYVLTADESDEIISRLNDELILESILDQIQHPLNSVATTRDYLTVFENRYNYLHEVYIESSDFISALDAARYNIYTHIFDAITDHYKITYDSDDFDIITAVQALYNFFCLDYLDDIVAYLIHIITTSKKSIVLSLADPTYSKSLSTKALKKVLKDRDDAIIIAHISTVVQNIVSVPGYDPVQLIDDITQLDIYDATKYHMYKYFIDDGTFIPQQDFAQQYFDILIHKKQGYSRIISEIKTYLLDTAPKKVKKTTKG